MKRKIISIFLVVVSLLFCFPLTVSAASDKATTSYVIKAGNGSSYFMEKMGDSLPLRGTSDSNKQSDVKSLDIDFVVKDVVAGSTLDCTIVFNNGGAYRVQSFSRVRAGTVKNNSVDTDFTYNASTGTLNFSFDVDEIDAETAQGVPVVDVSVWCDVSSTTSPNANAWISLTGVSVQSESQSKGFQNKIAAWFQNLFGWLKDIRDNALDLGKNIGSWFTQLGNNIKGFFTDLGNSIKEQFTNMIDKLKGFFDNVGQWFKDIGDRIGGFFTTLWNKLWYGNENGAAEYQKPVISNKLDDILATLTDYQIQLKGTIDTIGTAADSVSSYISTGTQLVNGIINVAGAGFTALIVFGMVFVLVRKVVGR